MNFQSVLLDTDFIFSLFSTKQSTHEQADQIYQVIQEMEWVMLDITHFELATVLAYKVGMPLAKQILETFERFSPVIISIKAFEEEIWEYFLNQKTSKGSFIDCANLVMAQKRGYKIASFDHFYPKEYLVGV